MKSKSINLFNSFLILSILIVSGCQSDVDTTATDGTITCKIDGADWTAATLGANIINGRISVSGISTEDFAVSMTLTGDTEGTYSLNPSLANAVAHTESSNGSSSAFVSNQNQSNTNYGSVVISEINTADKLITGTFETEAHRLIDGEVRIITEGVFTNIPYEEELAPTTSSLSATVDGSVFQATSVIGFVALGILTISGTDATGSKSIGLRLPEGIAAGTYNLGSLVSDYVGLYNADTSTFLNSDSGSITITEHQVTNKIIKGTFDFEASEIVGEISASITGGSFVLTY